MELASFPPLSPRILRCLLEFWKIRVPMAVNVVDLHDSTAWDLGEWNIGLPRAVLNVANGYEL